ncbi:hypothetical protein EUGRSUZ_A00530 [Eucalyptus grandis]|uniref:Uncharacterized protein n=2 Tax=Eucalyptus grandis TaxID=71139 RepID=A0A059DCD3_EUCGR|nr:hypothetical protein EUGRSUZ_A00530 [Eucalyptus grandis]
MIPSSSSPSPSPSPSSSTSSPLSLSVCLSDTMLSFILILCKMKSHRAYIPLSVVTALICTCALMVLLFTEKVTSLSSFSIFRLISCANRDALPKYRIGSGEYRPEIDDDRFEFDPEECNDTARGKWVFNASLRPLYSDRSCAYLEKQVTCKRNGRPDSDYLHWEWQADDCYLPKFKPEVALKKLRGKRLMFVGDSIQRGQWMSFVCMVQSIIPKDQKFLSRSPSRSHLIFRAKEYNTTIEFYWAPFLVESNTDQHIISDPNKRILRIDSISKHAKIWKGVDLLVFNSYIWWMSGPHINSLWGSFANGEEGYEGLDRMTAYRLALKTWANWIDSAIDPNRTRLFFTTLSPTHIKSEDWGNKNGIKCYNETKPAMKVTRSWVDRMPDVVSSIVKKMRVPVTFINITQLSEYRVDGHVSVYGESRGKVLTEEQRADPLRYADCIHWCLPGVPDTWNRILYAYL